ncbi:MAG: formate dehydrogenase [Nitrospira sp. CR1.1]|jgi:NADH:ubiquinone oxidoreductase subunit E|nr:formate dehydrogenase [Nitrospira sp. CR1.1]
MSDDQRETEDDLALHEQVEQILRQVRNEPPNILKTLLAIQDQVGHVPVDAIPDIAHSLRTSTAQIAGVLSYYPELRVSAPGRHLIRICMGESCYANGCSRVLRELQNYLRADVGETTPGAKFTLATMSCAGNCAVSPTVLIGRDLYGRVLPSQVESMLERYR